MEEYSTPWTSTHSLSGISPEKPRCIDCVDVAYWAYLREHRDPSDRASDPHWFCDVSQAVQRMAWGSNVPCFNKDPLPYSFSLDRILTFEDCGCGVLQIVLDSAGYKGRTPALSLHLCISFSAQVLELGTESRQVKGFCFGFSTFLVFTSVVPRLLWAYTLIMVPLGVSRIIANVHRFVTWSQSMCQGESS